jgi:hypothetical protein
VTLALSNISEGGPKSRIDTVELDVLLSEKFTERVVTTEHPVEVGADPTDHVRITPATLQLEGMFTDTPIPEADRIARGEAHDGAGPGYALGQYRLLQALLKGRAIDVETGARKYVSMQITELAQSRDSKTGTSAVQFTCQLKEIIFVSTETVRGEQVSAPTGITKTPTGKVEQGKKVASTTTPVPGGIANGLIFGNDGGGIQ